MKKSLILLGVFSLLDLILVITFTHVNNGNDFAYYFLPAIFLEIAIFGSIIIYEVSKKGGKKDD
ncbi:MAG: hypothetical protein RSA91_06910 [Bacilli bacterium]